MTTKIKAKKELQIIRIASGYSMKELGKGVSMCESTVSLIESGKRGTRPNTAKRICEFLNKSFEELFSIVDESEKE